MTLHELIDTLQQQHACNPFQPVRIELLETDFSDRSEPIRLQIETVRQTIHETVLEVRA